MVEYRLLHHVHVLFLTIDQVLKMLEGKGMRKFLSVHYLENGWL